MNKFVRFLIPSIVLFVLILTSIQEADSQSGFVGTSVSSIAMPSVARETNDRIGGPVFVEFFAGQ